MASLSAYYCLCVIILGMCSASGVVPQGLGCPAPCRCLNSTITCNGCPNSYVTVFQTTRHLYVKACKDIQYLLKFHQHDGIANTSLSKLEIADSFIRQPETFIYSDYNIQVLILTNNSINALNPDPKQSNVTLLDLSHNSILTVNNRTFSNVKKLLYLDLSGNRIVNLSVECFSGLGKLLHMDLSSNNLTLLSDAVFQPLLSLQKLNLSSNQLEVLCEKSFSSLLMLQQLDISYNKLTSVAPGTLQFLPNLARLLLADNPQLRPDAQIFVGTGRRLQQVDASRTGLSQVPEALTHSVRYLTLAGNRIAAVSCGDLDSYPLLHMLDFTHNIITDIEDDALGRLEMLSQLYLNNNRLRTVPKMLPDKLHYLSLDTNLIGNLTITDFTTLTNLKILILSNNAISYIQENAFFQLISLEVLDLSNNPLKALTPNTFSGPVSLKDLRIAFVNISPPAKDISFPVPSPEGIENLHLEFSPGLTRQLMADTAALAAMTRLQHLDMRYSNISMIRSDLLHFWPQLKILRLEGNMLNCSDLRWLADWMRENPANNYEQVKCFSPPALVGKLVIDLHSPASTQTPVYTPKNRFSQLNITSKRVLNLKRPDSNNILNQLRNASAILNDVSRKGKLVKKNDSNQIDSFLDKKLMLRSDDAKQEKAVEDSRSKLLEIFSEWSQEPQKAKGKIGTTEATQFVPFEEVLSSNASVVEMVQNASEYQTSRFSAEEGGFSGGGTGAIAVAGAGIAAAGAALAVAWAARRRPRPPHHHHQDLMMEVPTIAAVGELW
ncbi:leucine-rich repeat-containing protein 2mit [Arctopsyche grandis]|uniref:leucine-rich repeat-containing protein 2mit n=1 Tax=Arctopsyche grandis TaxID=121162 RepID=UPI00406D7904